MSEKPIVEDFLESDPAIRGQNWVCLSFISPEKVLKNKEIFKMKKFLEFLFKDEPPKQEIDADGNPMPLPPLSQGQEMFKRITENRTNITYEMVGEMYDDWKFTREEGLESEFHEQNDFQTTMRGLKVRGVYDTKKEAEVRAQVLHRRDPAFHTYIGQVGYWLPWDPSPDSVQEQEYADGMLNNLVKKYKENLDLRDEHYEEMKREKLAKARAENAERRRKLQEEGIKTEHLHAEEVSHKNVEALRSIIDGEKAASTGVGAGDSLSRVNEKEGASLDATEAPGLAEASDPTQGFQSEQMKSLDEIDPWLRRKMESSQSPSA